MHERTVKIGITKRANRTKHGEFIVDVGGRMIAEISDCGAADERSGGSDRALNNNQSDKARLRVRAQGRWHGTTIRQLNLNLATRSLK